MNHKLLWPKRRQALAKIGLAAISTLFTPFVWTHSKSKPRQIVIRDSGGIITKIYDDLLYKPFTLKTGIKVIGVTSSHHPAAQVQMMVQAKNYQWDMACLNDIVIAFLTKNKECFLEKHELEQDPFISSVFPQFISPYGVGAEIFATGLVYRTDKFKGKKTPQSWQDFWDVEQFPGHRSLYKHPVETIEISLMANGVAPDKIYPCDLDHAFRSLDKIKPYINIWCANGPHVDQLLNAWETDLMPAYILRARPIIASGVPYAISWNHHLYGCMKWAILKGSPNADACRQFIRFASEPKRQAQLALRGMGPSQPESFKYIPLEQAKKLASYPDNLKKGLHINTAYWAKNQAAVIERFNEWMLS